MSSFAMPESEELDELGTNSNYGYLRRRTPPCVREGRRALREGARMRERTGNAEQPLIADMARRGRCLVDRILCILRVYPVR